jgi:Protein of unknown function (DUF3105)
MSRSPQPPHQDRRTALPALLLYIGGWLMGAAVLAVVVLVLLSGRDDDVALPPIQETELSSAATRAGCVLRSGANDASVPPVNGTAADPVAAGVYDEPPDPAAIVGALRRGTIVINYRPDELPDDVVDALRTLQEAVPRATVVAPNVEMRFVVAVTAWRHLLGCRRVSDRTLDAVRLFSGRFVGSGPDSDS